jgi:transcriptional regulator with XRE-family HTH domain
VDFIDALSQLLETKQLTKMALHKKLGVSRQTLDNYLDRITSPTDAEIKEMSKKLDISTLVKSYPEQVKMIPFYDAVAVGGTSVQAEQDPITKPMEMINPGTWFKTAQGSGSIIAFKNGADHAHKIIHYGEDYVIELDDLRIIKRVQKSKEKDCIQVNSYNTMKDDTGAQVFAPYDIPLAAIRRMYRVLGKVELEASI